MEITIRAAEETDMTAIHSIVMNYPKQLMKDIPSVKSFFVAVHERKVIGCCALDIYSKRIAEIRSFAVLPEFEGKGIGTRLLKKCRARARKEGIREVFAITSRPHLFQNAGFNTFQEEKTALFIRLKK
jgi:amino-acid N-acetyltransferase